MSVFLITMVFYIYSTGLDWGGVSREFFSIISNKCFDCSNGLFHRFKEDHQALVHQCYLCQSQCENTLLYVGTSQSTSS